MAPVRKYKPTSAEKLTAITLEARRLGKSYAELSHELQNDGQREYEIISAYIAAKQEKEKRKEERCMGCAYNVQSPYDSRKRVCSFNQTERIRRKDQEGNCLEFTTKKVRRRNVQTKFQRLLNGDWSEKTVAEIAAILDTSADCVHQMVHEARKKGVEIAFKRTNAGRKRAEDGE